MPVSTVATAAQRNHHSARLARISIASIRAGALIWAKAGTCTRLK